jgi:hypothetical protein
VDDRLTLTTNGQHRASLEAGTVCGLLGCVGHDCNLLSASIVFVGAEAGSASGVKVRDARHRLPKSPRQRIVHATPATDGVLNVPAREASLSMSLSGANLEKHCPFRHRGGCNRPGVSFS